MPAVQETVEQVRRIDVDQYKYGFETLIESDKAPKGLSEDTVRFISAKKSEPEWMLAWRLDAYRRWLTMREPKWAKVEYGPIDYQNSYYYSAPKKAPQSLDEIDPEILRTYEKLGIPLREREALLGIQSSAGEGAEAQEGENGGNGYGRVAVDAVFDSVSVATTFQAELAKAGRAVHADFRGAPEASRPGEEVPRDGGADQRQFLRDVECGGVFRRIVRLCAAGRALSRWSCRPISGSTSAIPASSSARSSSPTRAPTSATSKAAPRRCATKTSFMRPWSNSSRSTMPRSNTRPSRTGIRATRRARAASITSSPSAAIAAATTRRSPGPSSKPARPSPGNIRAASCAAITRAASSIRSLFRTVTSRSIPAPRCCIWARTRPAGSSPKGIAAGTRTTPIGVS